MERSTDAGRHWLIASEAPQLPDTIWREARCPLMPAEAHCFHEQLRLWDDPFPPAVVCCWCGHEATDAGAVPHRHGPHVPEE